jgi:ABC-type transport system involved in cytochrome c biogenesis permease subunit
MYETLWWVAFGVMFAGLLLGAVHAVIALALASTGGEAPPRALVWYRRGVNAVLVAGFLALSAAIAARWVEAGYPPFSNIPESLMWMAWGFCAVYFVVRLFTSFPGLEAGASVGVLGILAFSCLFDHAPRPLMPALQSNWLIFHVLTCMVSYGAFFLAFCMAGLWLAVWRKYESGKLVDALSHQTMAFGFLLLTVGIVSGSVWARQAWGRYWGWDPKETWSLITWFIYGIYLHLRLIAPSLGIRRERLPALNAVFAVVGFAATAFTYLGVSYLLPSLHSYAS